MRISSSCEVTTAPRRHVSAMTVPAQGDGTTTSIFMASILTSTSPTFTRSPGRTNTFQTLPEIGGRTGTLFSSADDAAAVVALLLVLLLLLLLLLLSALSVAAQSATSASKATCCLAWKAAMSAALSSKKRRYAAK